MTEIGQTSAHRVKATHSYRFLHTMQSVITGSGHEGCPSRASYQSPSSHSSQWAGLLRPPSSPQWRAQGCRRSPSSQQTWIRATEKEEQEGWSEAKSRAKEARKYRRQRRTKQTGINSREVSSILIHINLSISHYRGFGHVQFFSTLYCVIDFI